MIVNIIVTQQRDVSGVMEKSNKEQKAYMYHAISQLAILNYLKVPSLLS